MINFYKSQIDCISIDEKNSPKLSIKYIFNCKMYQYYKHYFFILKLKNIRNELIPGERRVLKNYIITFESQGIHPKVLS